MVVKNIYAVNSFCLWVNHASRHIEEKRKNKYFILDHSVDENKELLKKYTDLCDEVENEIRTINGGNFWQWITIKQATAIL